jgi:hypothetical protein
MKRGQIVWPCYDGKMGRAVPGIVIRTGQNHKVLVRFTPYAAEQPGTIDVWFKRSLNTQDPYWSVNGHNNVQKFAPRHKFSAWAREDDMMNYIIGGDQGSYYLLRTEAMMTKYGNPSFKGEQAGNIAALRATL